MQGAGQTPFTATGRAADQNRQGCARCPLGGSPQTRHGIGKAGQIRKTWGGFLHRAVAQGFFEGVSAADGYDIALATQAAMKIQNPELRDAVTAMTLGRWLREDAVAARAWMDANSIPDAIRQAARNR